MTPRQGLARLSSYGSVVALCGIVVGAMNWLLIRGSASAALIALILGSFGWGLAAGKLGASPWALPVIALIVELAVAFEFKRVYVLDYFGGPPPRSVDVFSESIFVGDALVVAILAGLGWAGWRWQRKWVTVSA
jgi:hypothetical protein